MGIDVSVDKTVSINNNHNYRVVTNVDKNPTIKALVSSGIKIINYSVYRRTKSGDYDRDGNPLIYVLKGLKGYSITNKEIYRFRPTFDCILHKIKMNYTPTKKIIILTLPSSSTLTRFFAKKVSRYFNTIFFEDVFLKKDCFEVLEGFEKECVHRKHIDSVNRVLVSLSKNSKNRVFSMKNVPNKVRCYFNPLKINQNFDLRARALDGCEIILVDDLLSTGTTIISAAHELKKINVFCHSSVCLLSNL